MTKLLGGNFTSENVDFFDMSAMHSSGWCNLKTNSLSFENICNRCQCSAFSVSQPSAYKYKVPFSLYCPFFFSNLIRCRRQVVILLFCLSKSEQGGILQTFGQVPK